MKFAIPMFGLMVCAYLAGCASQPDADKTSTQKPAPVAAAPQPLPATAATSSTLTKEKILALQKEGYKIVDRDGQQYFCRIEKKTGSTIARDTVCVTEKEVDQLREMTRQRMGEFQRQLPPPQGK